MIRCVCYVLSFWPRPAGGVRCKAGRIQVLQLKCGRCKYKYTLTLRGYLVTPAETVVYGMYATTLQEQAPLLFQAATISFRRPQPHTIITHPQYSTLSHLRKKRLDIPLVRTSHVRPQPILPHSLIRVHSPHIPFQRKKSQGAHSAASRSLDTGSGEWSIASPTRYEPRPYPALVSHRLWPRG